MSLFGILPHKLPGRRSHSFHSYARSRNSIGFTHPLIRHRHDVLSFLSTSFFTSPLSPFSLSIYAFRPTSSFILHIFRVPLTSHKPYKPRDLLPPITHTTCITSISICVTAKLSFLSTNISRVSSLILLEFWSLLCSGFDCRNTSSLM